MADGHSKAYAETCWCYLANSMWHNKKEKGCILSDSSLSEIGRNECYT